MSKKLVRGMGINDVDSPAFKRFPDGPDGPKVWTCPYYWQWGNMLSRCTDKWQDKYPCYVGVTICEEWKTLSVFKKWMMEQDWEGKALDKDIIKEGNKEYGPVLCRFVNQTTNSVMSKNGMTRRKNLELPKGIQRVGRGGKEFQATVGGQGKPHYRRGRFTELEDAVAFYKKYKAVLLRSCLELESDPEILKGIEREANKLTTN